MLINKHLTVAIDFHGIEKNVMKSMATVNLLSLFITFMLFYQWNTTCTTF